MHRNPQFYQIKFQGHNLKGFTLIELLIVIALIGSIATFAIVSLQNAQMDARNAQRMEDMRSIQHALEIYVSDFNSYPIDSNDGGACGCDYDSTPSGSPDFISVLSPTYIDRGVQDPIQDSGSRNLLYRYISDDGLSYTLQFNVEPNGAGNDCPENAPNSGGWCTLISIAP